MKKFVLFCKTFRRDLDRTANLIDSIHTYNSNNIPIYLSVPGEDFSLFENKFGTQDVTLLRDEDLTSINHSEPNSGTNWYQQQVVKMSFGVSEISENFLLLDSDSYFIRPFYLSDFMYGDDVPYTVMHEQRDLFEFTDRYRSHIGFDPRIGYEKDRRFVMNALGRTGRVFDFGPSPVIWSSKVWKSIWNEYMVPSGLDFQKLINLLPSEFTWYGEWLLLNRPIDIIPIGPLFKVFHYDTQYQFYKQLEWTESIFAKGYMGIIMQSNFSKNLKF